MSADSPKGFSSFASQGAGLLDRVQPQAQNKSLSEIQSEVDGLMGSAVATVSDEKMMASLLGAGLAGRFIRLGSVAASGKSLAPLAVQGLSHITALAGESAVFAGMERSFAKWEGHLPTQSFQKDWARAFINLGSIKILGGAAQGQNLFTQHFLIDGAMVTGHHAGYALGVTERPRGSLAQQMIHAEGMNLGMKGSLALLHGSLPKLSATERAIDLTLKSQERGLSLLLPQSSSQWAIATATGGGGARRDLGTLTPSQSEAREMVWEIGDREDPKRASREAGEATFAREVGAPIEPGFLPRPEMIRIPAGTFHMGVEGLDNNSVPAREIFVSEFEMGKYAVTNEQYAEYLRMLGKNRFAVLRTDPDSGLASIVAWERSDISAVRLADQLSRFMMGSELIYQVFEIPKEHPSPKGFDQDRQPVVNVNWYEALAFSAAVGGRLPTEAEWEKAAKGPEGYKYGTRSGELKEGEAHFGKKWTAEVGSYPPNGYGLHEMTGNVWDWVMDWYAANAYRDMKEKDPTGPVNGHSKVLRGGSYSLEFNDPDTLRAAERAHDDHHDRYEDVGLRPVVAPRDLND